MSHRLLRAAPLAALLSAVLMAFTATPALAMAEVIQHQDDPVPAHPGQAAAAIKPQASARANPLVAARAILVTAAQAQSLDPSLLLAVSWWESGWNQSAVSSEGAVGIMQVMPKTATTAGPMLLHRNVNLADTSDNAQMGAALLQQLVARYGPRQGLAAYYQGEPAMQAGTFAPDTYHYADSILDLANDFRHGLSPSSAP